MYYTLVKLLYVFKALTLFLFNLFASELTTTVAHRHNPRFWFGLHSTNPSNLSELYWDDCRVADWVEWTIYRPSYIPEHYQCLGFDVEFHPLTTVTYILWLSIACQEQNRFICVWGKK